MRRRVQRCGDAWCRECWPPMLHIYVVLAMVGVAYTIARLVGLDL